MSLSFTLSSVIRQISQLCINRNVSPHCIPVPEACQLSCLLNMEMMKLLKKTQIITPFPQIHLSRQRRWNQKTEACYGNFLLFILKKFARHIQSKRCQRKVTIAANETAGCSGLSCIDFPSVSHFSGAQSTHNTASPLHNVGGKKERERAVFQVLFSS